jgi:DNA repair protein SbcD/Mre11
MRFAHIADCHVGAWRDTRLRDLSTESFIIAMDRCVEEHVDFVLISGDLFNTAIPPIDSLRTVVAKFRMLRDNSIPIYVITGSHDYSPSGKTIVSVLEEAKLCRNVQQGDWDEQTSRLHLNFTLDKKTGIKLTGIGGRKQGLERNYYDVLDRESLESEPGTKIFLFHSALSELHGIHDYMEAQSIASLPKNFIYYAGGHVHKAGTYQDLHHKNVVYPGPLFPNSFSELEELECGKFNFVEIDNNESNRVTITVEEIRLHPVVRIFNDVTQKSPEEVAQEIERQISRLPIQNAIVTVRLTGILREGTVSAIDFTKLYSILYRQGAYSVLRNTAGVTTPEYQEKDVHGQTPEETENIVLQENSQSDLLPQSMKAREKELAHALMHVLSTEKREGENTHDFESRIIDEVQSVLGKYTL